MSFCNLTWTCHVCGDNRPDDRIAVYKTSAAVDGVEVQANVRYCRDRVGCEAGAPAVAERWLQAADGEKGAA